MGRGTTSSPSVSKSSPAGPQARTYSPSTKPWGDVPPRPRLAHAAARYSRFARRPLGQREETRPFALRRRLPSQVGVPATPYALESTRPKPPGSGSAPRLPGTGPQEGTRRQRNCRPGQPPLARGFRPVPTYLKRRRAGRFSAVALQALPPGTANAGHNDALQWTDWGKSLCAHLRRTSGQWQSALAAAQPIRGDLVEGAGNWKSAEGCGEFASRRATFCQCVGSSANRATRLLVQALHLSDWKFSENHYLQKQVASLQAFKVLKYFKKKNSVDLDLGCFWQLKFWDTGQR